MFLLFRMDELLNSEQTCMRLKNSIDIEELRKNSEITFELQKDDESFEINGEKFSSEAFKDMYLNIAPTEEDRANLFSTSFEKMAENMTDISGDGGVLKKLLKPGEGPIVPEEAIVRTHYNGFVEYNDEPFDSTRLRGEVFKFRLKYGSVIPGWEIAIRTMKKGEISQFLISPAYGFGELGCPPRIPEATLALFEIELLSFVDEVGIEDYCHLNEEEKSKLTFEQINKMVLKEKSLATEYFQSKNLHKAYNKYKLATQIIEDYLPKNYEERRQGEQFLLTLNLNMALCCIRLNHSGRAVTYCQKALQLDNTNTKAFYRLGQAYHQLGRYSEAITNLNLAKKQLPSDSNISKLLQQLHEDVLKHKEEESKIYRRMFCQKLSNHKSSLLTTNLEDASKAAEEKSVAISNDFREKVSKYLNDFVSENCQQECPMPAYNLSVAEIAFLLEKVDELGLQAVQTGSGENMCIRIRKPGRQRLREHEVILT